MTKTEIKAEAETARFLHLWVIVRLKAAAQPVSRRKTKLAKQFRPFISFTPVNGC